MNQLANALKPVTALLQTPKGSRKKKNQNQQSRKQGNYNTNTKVNRAKGLSTDPSFRGAPDNALSLTRSQFTATSPQNFWEFISASSPGGCRIRGRELINSLNLSVASTGSFTLLGLGAGGGTGTIFLNPQLFPRLSTISNAFEWYIFHKANLFFQSNQPTTATGEVSVAVDYDPKDPIPASMIDMMRNITSTMANVYSDASCQALKSLSRLPRYAVAETATVDSSQVNQGRIFSAVDGYTGAIAASVGYLVIEYDIEFFTPQ